MIYSLNGKLMQKSENFVVVDCAGVGYRCFTTPNVISGLGALGSEVILFTYLNIKEALIELYGFSDLQELICFKTLIGVSGVGAKFALSILSVLTPSEVAFGVESGNSKSFTIAHGIGTKLAQRIVLELKGKFKIEDYNLEVNCPARKADSKRAQAVGALEALGYLPGEAIAALRDCDETLNLEEMIKQGLANAGGKGKSAGRLLDAR